MIQSLRKAFVRNPILFQARRLASKPDMFCFQCEQTRGGKHCGIPRGVCEKSPSVAALQDLVVDLGKRIASYAYLGSTIGYNNPSADYWITNSYFATLTNVNFDAKRFEIYLKEGAEVLKNTREGYIKACKKTNRTPEVVINGDWDFKPGLEELVKEGRLYGIDKQEGDWNTVCVKEMATYGLKGGLAYLHHAMQLGYEEKKLYTTAEKLLHELRARIELNEALGIALDVGEWNLDVMKLLDKANTESFGHPEITTIRTTPVKGKGILVSGHDMRDLDLVLHQTVGKNINVYTHGEMMPCNAYPGLKKFKQLVGNYGGAWYHQKEDFAAFPGSILMTTNCIISPRESYSKRLFTRAVVGWPGVQHIEGDDMGELIKAAEGAEGFKEDAPKKEITIGFGRNAVLNLAPVIVSAVKAGAIKHFFLVGGCDGPEPKRSYYKDFATKVPKDCVILTLACGRYRICNLDLGYIEFEGKKIPRLLDIGQCNDAYSAIQIALTLSKVFNLPVNELPLSFVVSWFEQKAVAILLTLLKLNIRNIILGPNLPAFVTPDVLKVLVENYSIRPISTPELDIKYLLEQKK